MKRIIIAVSVALMLIPLLIGSQSKQLRNCERLTISPILFLAMVWSSFARLLGVLT